MAILEILTVPHPLLTQKCRPVRADEFGAELARFCADMAETMYAAPGVGLAAPQVGDLRRIVVADPGNNSREEEENGNKEVRFVAMINPVIIETSRDSIVWEEGCLSVPEFNSDVKRPRRAKLRWQDPQGKPEEAWFEGYDAVVVQHELDHLEGTVILDRVSFFKRSRYLSKRQKQRDRDEARV